MNSKIKRNRIIVSIFFWLTWALLWLLTDIFENIWIMVIGLFFLFVFAWPYVNKKYYKMDEFDWKIHNKSWYLAFLFTMCSILVLLGLNDLWKLQELKISIESALSLLLFLSIWVYFWFYIFYSYNPDKLN